MKLRSLGVGVTVVVFFATMGAARAGNDDTLLPPGATLDGGVPADGGPSTAGNPDGATDDDDLDIKPKKKHFVEEPPPPPKPVCTTDDQCQLGTICEAGQCKRVQPLISNEEGHKNVPPFYFHYWKHHSGEDHDLKVVPFLIASQETDKHEKSTRVWPFIYHKTYLEDGHKIGTQAAVLPIFWWQKRKTVEHGSVPLLFTGWQRDSARDFTELLAGLFVYYKREKTDAWRVVFPLYWDHGRPGSRFATFLPIFYYNRDGDASQAVFLPILWRWHNESRGYTDTLVFPLFNYLTARHGRQKVFVSWLGGYEHDVDADRTQSMLLTFYRRRDRDLDLDLLFPIFARWNSRQTRTSGIYAGPFVSFSDESGSTSTFFPLFWRVVDKKAHAQTNVFFPIGGMQKRPGFVAASAGPVFAWTREPKGERLGGWGAGIAPILFFGHNDQSHHAALLPLFYWSRDSATGKQFTAVGPIFVRNNPPTHGTDVGILPLFWFGKETGRAYAYIAPLFWYRKTPERTTGVFGPLFISLGKKREEHRDYDAGLAPIAFFHRHKDETAAVVLPLVYHVTKPGESTTVVLPFAHARRGDTITDALFPVAFAQRSPGETTVGTLLGGWHKKDGHAVGVFGPYIYTGDETRHTSTHVLFPLAFRHSSPNASLTAVFPVFWDAHTGTEHDTLFVPLFWHRRGGYTDIDVFFPIFARAKSPHSTTYLFGPVYARSVNHGWTQGGLFGLFSFGQKREGDKVSRFAGGPAFFYSRNDWTGQRRFLFGPLFDWRKPEGNTSGLFPIVFEARRGTTTYAVTPFYYHQHDKATGLYLDVLGPLYWGKSTGQTYVGLAPIFFGNYGPKHSQTVVFPLLYYAKKESGGSTLLTFLGGYSSNKDGYKALIGPLYVRHDTRVHAQYLFPFIYHGVDQVTKAVTTVAFPFYADHQDSIEGTRIQAFTPLVWRYRSVERTITIGFPLVFDANIHGESRASGFLPFFLRKRSEVTKSSWWSVPLLLLWGRERHDDDTGDKVHDFVFFPLVWRYGGKERSTTVAFPFYWNFNRGDDQTLVVFPLMAKWKRYDGDRLVVFNTYYRKGKGPREGSWTVNVIPFFDIGHPRKQDFEWNFLEGLFGYSRLGRNRTLKLFWFIPIPLAPVPESNLSWWSNTTPDRRTEF